MIGDGVGAALVFIILAGTPWCAYGEVNATESSVVVANERKNLSEPTKTPEERIINGEFASPNEFPHQVLMVFVNASADTSRGILIRYCGGSIIAPEWILTAAHCVDAGSVGEYEFLGGKHTFAPFERDPPVQTRKVARIFVHRCYAGQPVDPLVSNDIALIRLTEKFDLTRAVATIPIDSTDLAKPDTMVTTIGWGRQSPTDTTPPRVLKKANFKLPAEGICEKSPILTVHNASQQCDLDFSESVCTGDSGGPLLCNDNDTKLNHVCGVASFVTHPDCLGGGVFTRVFHFRNWIAEVMKTGIDSQTDCVCFDGKCNPLRPINTGSTVSTPHLVYATAILISCLRLLKLQM